ncbi:7325_t:CDS:2 [Acaulospora colombiana]|uniref:7325_t:CDS:1 n=1 Tax=Acaulospora colombiana TaxID=27376 RepID=A0ACA9N942_9GLOM|nr:7325_t:CDS:2 [Acaulospora colombiana]
MSAKPLPMTVLVFFYTSGILMFITFVLSMVNLAEFDLYLVPVSVALTILHHITLVAISLLKARPPNVTNTSESTLVSRPALPTDSNSRMETKSPREPHEESLSLTLKELLDILNVSFCSVSLASSFTIGRSNNLELQTRFP